MADGLTYNEHKLFEFVAAGNIEMVQQLLNGVGIYRAVNVNCQDKRGKTVLITALQKKNPQMVRFLVEQGADIEHTDSIGNTPLIYAVINKDIEMTRFLLEQGVQINRRNNCGSSAISCAAANNDINMLYLLDEFQADFHTRNNNGESLLSETFLNLRSSSPIDHLETVKLLVEQGLDINEADKNGRTLLMSVAMGENVDLLRYLINQNASVNARDNTGETALMKAMFLNRFDMVKILLERHANLHLKNAKGETALITAVIHGDIKLVKLLLENGADKSINDVNKHGRTAFIEAFNRHKDTEILNILIKYGAKADSRYCQSDGTYWGRTLLAMAVEKGDFDKVQLLVNQGIDLNVTNDVGQTAVMIAAQKKEYAIMKYLLQSGCRVDMRDKSGNTVFDYLQSNNPEMCAKLKRINDRFFKSKLRQCVKTKTGDELFVISERDAEFVNLLIIGGLISEALEKMSYQQSCSIYMSNRKTLTDESRRSMENIIRMKRTYENRQHI